jgi:hypothetical protein
MNNRKLEDWAKNEFLQVLVSAAMVGGLVALMAPGTGIITKAFDSLVPGNLAYSTVCTLSAIPPNTAICFAFGYLSGLEGEITQLVGAIFSINFFLDLFSKLSVDVIVVQIAPLSGLTSIVQVLYSIMQSLIYLGILTGVEMSLLIFANATALTVFLPLGLVLRCFFATRRIGGALMAMAVGAYLVFPLAIALNAVALQASGDQMVNQTMASLTSVSNQVQQLSIWANFKDPGDVVTPAKWTAYLSKFNGAAQSLVSALADIPAMLMTAVSALVVQVVFLPVISIMITIIAIKELAGLFGGEINLSKFEV